MRRGGVADRLWGGPVRCPAPGHGEVATARDESDRAGDYEEGGGDAGHLHPHLTAPSTGRRRRLSQAGRFAGGRILQVGLELPEVLDVRVHFVSPGSIVGSVAGCRPRSCNTSARRRSPRLTRCRALSSVHDKRRATSWYES